MGEKRNGRKANYESRKLKQEWNQRAQIEVKDTYGSWMSFNSTPITYQSNSNGRERNIGRISTFSFDWDIASCDRGTFRSILDQGSERYRIWAFRVDRVFCERRREVRREMWIMNFYVFELKWQNLRTVRSEIMRSGTARFVTLAPGTAGSGKAEPGAGNWPGARRLLDDDVCTRVHRDS